MACVHLHVSTPGGSLFAVDIRPCRDLVRVSLRILLERVLIDLPDLKYSIPRKSALLKYTEGGLTDEECVSFLDDVVQCHSSKEISEMYQEGVSRALQADALGFLKRHDAFGQGGATNRPLYTTVRPSLCIGVTAVTQGHHPRGRSRQARARV